MFEQHFYLEIVWNTVYFVWNYLLRRKPNHKSAGQQQAVHQYDQYEEVEERMHWVSLNPSMLHWKNENQEEEEVGENYLNYFWHNSEKQRDVVLEAKAATLGTEQIVKLLF
jgi:hypothetical protein